MDVLKRAGYVLGIYSALTVLSLRRGVLDLGDGVSDVESDSSQGDGNRDQRRADLPEPRLQLYNRPGLQEQRGFDKHDDGDGEDGGGYAVIKVDLVDAI